MSKLVGSFTDVGSATTTPPSSGSGIVGWLRGIYDRLGSTLNVAGPLTNAELRAAPIGAAEKYDLRSYAKLRTADDTIIPAAGKRLQLVWCQVVPNPDNSSANLVTVRMTLAGVLTDVYAVYAVGRSAVFTGDVNTNIVIDLDNTMPTTVNVQYREISG